MFVTYLSELLAWTSYILQKYKEMYTMYTRIIIAN